jgi:tRNA pseudouridine synthase 10
VNSEFLFPLSGRYNKFSRELPQTPWLVDGVRKMETSVEELITDNLKPAFTFDSQFFLIYHRPIP